MANGRIEGPRPRINSYDDIGNVYSVTVPVVNTPSKPNKIADIAGELNRHFGITPNRDPFADPFKDQFWVKGNQIVFPEGFDKAKIPEAKEVIAEEQKGLLGSIINWAKGLF